MYNIVTKVLTNRLKLIIDSVISKAQSAFVKGRQILNGIIIANEVVNYAERRRSLFRLKLILKRLIIRWSGFT